MRFGNGSSDRPKVIWYELCDVFGQVSELVLGFFDQAKSEQSYYWHSFLMPDGRNVTVYILEAGGAGSDLNPSGFFMCLNKLFAVRFRRLD